MTNVYFAVQDFLKSRLEQEFPQIAMIAEEKENRNLSPGCFVLNQINADSKQKRHVALFLFVFPRANSPYCPSTFRISSSLAETEP